MCGGQHRRRSPDELFGVLRDLRAGAGFIPLVPVGGMSERQEQTDRVVGEREEAKPLVREFRAADRDVRDHCGVTGSPGVPTRCNDGGRHRSWTSSFPPLHSRRSL